MEGPSAHLQGMLRDRRPDGRQRHRGLGGGGTGRSVQAAMVGWRAHLRPAGSAARPIFLRRSDLLRARELSAGMARWLTLTLAAVALAAIGSLLVVPPSSYARTLWLESGAYFTHAER